MEEPAVRGCSALPPSACHWGEANEWTPEDDQTPLSTWYSRHGDARSSAGIHFYLPKNINCLEKKYILWQKSTREVSHQCAGYFSFVVKWMC